MQYLELNRNSIDVCFSLVSLDLKIFVGKTEDVDPTGPCWVYPCVSIFIKQNMPTNLREMAMQRERNGNRKSIWCKKG